MNTIKQISIILSLFTIVSTSHALECYICLNQEGNVDKCIKNFAICEPGQDTCLSEIRWGSLPYWSQGAQKQFYVSKRCSTKRECEKIQRNNMPDCTHIWYQDWKCSECCQGDRCNYYIFSGSNNKNAEFLTVIAFSTLSIIFSWKFM